MIIIVDVMNEKSIPEHMTIASLAYLAVHHIKPVKHMPLVGKTFEAAHSKTVSTKIDAITVGMCHRLRIENLVLCNERKVVSNPKTSMVIGAIQIARPHQRPSSKTLRELLTRPNELDSLRATIKKYRIGIDGLHREDDTTL